MAYLEIKNFCKSFGQTEVLNGIDLSVEKGEAVSVIGSSGSGKTTLLRCVNFLEKPDKGVMILDGETLFDAETDKNEKESDLREKRLNFGLVFQSFNLFPQYNVLDNLTLAPLLLLKEKLDEQFKGKSRKQRKEIFNAEKEKVIAECTELLYKVGLSDKIKAYPCELSGGQCQRVAIARALALKPKILCFDEPTSALDPELTGEVLKVIRSLKNSDITMIIVTHEMGFAQKVSDKVVFMANGVVEECGSPKEIFENPKSEKLISFLSGIKNKDGD